MKKINKEEFIEDIRKQVDKWTDEFLSMSSEEQVKAGRQARWNLINDPNVPEVMRQHALQIAKKKGEIQ